MLDTEVYCVQGSWKSLAPPFVKVRFRGHFELYGHGFLRGRISDKGGESAVLGMMKGDSLKFQKFYFRFGEIFAVNHEMYRREGDKFEGVLEHRNYLDTSLGSVEMLMKKIDTKYELLYTKHLPFQAYLKPSKFMETCSY